MKILFADDDHDLVDLVRYSFQRDGYTVVTAYDGEMTLKLFQTERPDVIVMDIVMPKRNGIQVLQKIRSSTAAPIIMLSGIGEDDRIVDALDKGADDYIVKPFEPRELRDRVRALMRRFGRTHEMPELQNAPLEFGALTLNPRTRQVFVRNEQIPLTRIEFELLMLLMINPDATVTFDELLSNVWGYHGETNHQLVQVTVSRLRRKLQDNAASPRYIVDVPGRGYSFKSI